MGDQMIVAASNPGGPDVLKPIRGPIPVPGCGQVLIKNSAAGVNRPDLLQRQGTYPPPSGITPILGLEVAGTVVSVGPNVSNWSEGDLVCALVIGGGYAEYCLAEASLCLPIPEGFTMVMAAALPETFFTVWTNVFDRAQLTAGDHFLVHGGASGIGTTAIQLGVAFGATVYATAGTGEKCQKCRELGAVKAYNYTSEDFVQNIKKDTNGIGVDLILDMFGGNYFARNVEALASDGRLVQIAFRTGAEAERRIVLVDFMPAILKRLTITGSTLKPQSTDRKAAIAAALRKKVWPMLTRGTIKPVIDSVFPLAKANEAHARMEAGKNIGKIILALGD